MTTATMSVEERLVRIETKLDGFDKRLDDFADRFATRADLANLETRLIKWMVGLMVGSIVAASSIAVLVERLVG